MKTNIIFKRVVELEGSRQIEVKAVEVDIPGISRADGWVFCDLADKVTVGSEEKKDA